ncbi:hypothetical protein M877_03705 [Streptomyces niveus NCIMB 11891]|nr:hypothetical protein M877_03705 [Streptomyces niveus NCIMB 11891]
MPGAFATYFGGLGVYCALIALIPALRRLSRPLSAFLDDVTVPVSANLVYAVFLLLLAGAVASRIWRCWPRSTSWCSPSPPGRGCPTSSCAARGSAY